MYVLMCVFMYVLKRHMDKETKGDTCIERQCDTGPEGWICFGMSLGASVCSFKCMYKTHTKKRIYIYIYMERERERDLERERERQFSKFQC